MRILHVSDHFLPTLGGIETHVAALAARQAARGADVTVLTSTPATADGRTSADDRADQGSDHAADDGSDHGVAHGVAHGVDLGAVRVRRVRSVREGLAHDLASYDVVHAHVSVVAPFTAPVAARAARRGAPTVVTVHSLWSRMGPLPGLAAGMAGLRGAPVLWTAVSRVAADQLTRHLPAGTRVDVLPNAVAAPARARTRLPAPGNPVRLVSTMRVARRKRPLQLIRIFDELRRSVDVPVELSIVGDGPLRPRLEHQLRRDRLEDAVTVTGRVSPAAVLDLVARADLYVAPAVLESFGLAALEARCVGLPVVGHAASGMTDFVRDGVEGRLCSSDADMVQVLGELVLDDALRHRMSEHNRTVPSAMTWDHAMQAHDAAYLLVRQPARTRLHRPVEA